MKKLTERLRRQGEVICTAVGVENFKPMEEEAADYIEQLEAENAQLRRERDAAVADLKKDSHCLQCKYHRSNNGDCIGVSMCGKGRPEWEWRGVVKEDKAFVRDCQYFLEKTNADHIRSMTDDELANEFGGWERFVPTCPRKAPHCKMADLGEDCTKCFLEWLKLPFKEESK